MLAVVIIAMPCSARISYIIYIIHIYIIVLRNVIKVRKHVVFGIGLRVSDGMTCFLIHLSDAKSVFPNNYRYKYFWSL